MLLLIRYFSYLCNEISLGLMKHRERINSLVRLSRKNKQIQKIKW
ncbi:hypothetical protein HMPREF9419_1823 [Prevotella nigrescens ATCC 33563]|nr:hypothetical protein HMPREF9419_1823 [Prevotella nigrescens ATCC 33563]